MSSRTIEVILFFIGLILSGSLYALLGPGWLSLCVMVPCRIYHVLLIRLLVRSNLLNFPISLLSGLTDNP